MAARKAAFPRRTASGGLPASSATSASVSLRRSPAGTTRDSRPISSASAAGTRRPVTIRSIARFGLTVPAEQRADHERPQAAVHLGQAEGGGVRRQHQVAAQHQPHAAGQAQPLHRRDDRHRAGAHRQHHLAQQPRALVHLEAGGVRRHVAEVHAGAEDPRRRRW
jgi:hypothetical protein